MSPICPDTLKATFIYKTTDFFIHHLHCMSTCYWISPSMCDECVRTKCNSFFAPFPWPTLIIKWFKSSLFSMYSPCERAISNVKRLIILCINIIISTFKKPTGYVTFWIATLTIHTFWIATLTIHTFSFVAQNYYFLA